MNIRYHKSFKKQYKKSPKLVQGNFDKRVVIFMATPFYPLLNNHPLTGNRKGQWSINVTGDWRAVYEFESDNSVVFVEINTHSGLYG
jgi:addiction module RelE/StbE family toxin